MNLHLILQSKGGVGKSFIASMLAQFFLSKNKNILNIDIDPSNKNFVKVKALNAQPFELLDEDDMLDPKLFDNLIDKILNASNENVSDVIIDSGSSCFIDFSNYLFENSILSLLLENNINVIIHTVIVGSDSFDDSINCMRQISDNFIEAKIVVWLNNYFGVIERDGKHFTDFSVYKKYQERITSVIDMPNLKRLHLTSIDDLTKNCLTLNEAIFDSNKYTAVDKQRFKQIQRDYFSLLDQNLSFLDNNNQ